MAVSRVKPCEKIPAQVIVLPILDAYVPKIWASRILFWPLEDPTAFDQCYQNLREGLSRLLADVPTLLGNLTQGSTDDFRDLNNNIPDNASVEFTCGDVTTLKAVPTFADLQRTGFPTTNLRDALFSKLLIGPITEGSPMFGAKLSKLRGGVALVYATNHVVTDGWAVSEMEKLWALHTADVSKGMAYRRHKLATPDEDIRQRFSDPAKFSSDAPLDSALQIVPSEEAFMRLHKDPAAAAAAGRRGIWKIMSRLSDAGERPEPRYSTLFKFTPSKLADLKKAASSSNPEEWISTMDALTGLFWSRIAHMQQLSKKGTQKSTCMFYVNARARMQPPVPMAYIGNVVSPASAESSLTDLESDENGLKAAAQSLRKGMSGWSPARFEAFANKAMTLPSEKAVDINRSLILGKHNLAYNDLSKFASNTTDWGAPLGKVARVRLPRAALPGGAHGIVVYPKLPDGSLEVLLGCSDALRQALLNDKVFKQYAEFICTSVPPGQGFVANALIQTVFTLHSTGRSLWQRVSRNRATLGGILLAFALYSILARRSGKALTVGSK